MTKFLKENNRTLRCILQAIKWPHIDILDQVQYNWVNNVRLGRGVFNLLTSQSLEPTIHQQLSCDYCCFMGSHVNYNLAHHCDALLYNLLHHYDALLLVESNAL